MHKETTYTTTLSKPNDSDVVIYKQYEVTDNCIERIADAVICKLKEEGKKMGVTRTERGWAGHYICANECKFRRNTLLEYKDRKWIVSTVGCYINPYGKVDMIGADRRYETMVFEAKLCDGYWDANVKKQIYPDSDWCIWGHSWREVKEDNPTIDNVANDMHERIVHEMELKIQLDEDGQNETD